MRLTCLLNDFITGTLPKHAKDKDLLREIGYSLGNKDILVYTVDEIKEWENVKAAFITSILEKGKTLYERKI